MSCKTWRGRAEAWLRAHPPDVIVVSNTRDYHLVSSTGKVLTGRAFESRWREGLATTLGKLPGSSVRVVLGDTPHMVKDIPVCLGAHGDDVSACQTRRADAWRKPHDAAEAAAAADRHVVFVSLNATVCSYDPCPIVVDNLLMWRDPSHMTATYAAELAPAVVPFLQEALATARTARAPRSSLAAPNSAAFAGPWR